MAIAYFTMLVTVEGKDGEEDWELTGKFYPGSDKLTKSVAIPPDIKFFDALNLRDKNKLKYKEFVNIFKPDEADLFARGCLAGKEAMKDDALWEAESNFTEGGDFNENIGFDDE